MDIKRRRRRFYVAALQVKCLRVYGVSVTFMSTGYMYHGYDLRTGD